MVISIHLKFPSRQLGPELPLSSLHKLPVLCPWLVVAVCRKVASGRVVFPHLLSRPQPIQFCGSCGLGSTAMSTGPGFFKPSYKTEVTCHHHVYAHSWAYFTQCLSLLYSWSLQASTFWPSAQIWSTTACTVGPSLHHTQWKTQCWSSHIVEFVCKAQMKRTN